MHRAAPAGPATGVEPARTSAPRVLVFSRTAGFRHDSIPVAIATLRALGPEAGLRIDASEDPMRFDDAALAGYDAVVFANVTGEVLDASQRAAFERFVARGGGFMGVHAAADSGYDWPWYGALVGAWFARHPDGLQPVTVVFEDDDRRWQVTDEIYDYRTNPRSRTRVIAHVDTASHPSGGMGDDHPIAWCHPVQQGRAWYTGLGHDATVFADPVFRAHLVRGLRHAAGLDADC